MLVKASNLTRRYVGTIYTSAAVTLMDNPAQRFIWSFYHRVPKPLLRQETASSWSYTLNAWHQANASTANRVELVRGLNFDLAEVIVLAKIFSASQVNAHTGVGLDRTNGNDAQVFAGACGAGAFNTATAHYRGLPGIGYHALNWLENSDAVGTTFWYGTNSPGLIEQGGMIGTCWC